MVQSGGAFPQGQPAVPATQRALPTARVVKRVDHTPDLFSLWLKPDIPNFMWKPGQYCTIGVENTERAYSIVSAPFEGMVELFVELVSNGELTPRLFKLKMGDSVSIRPSAKGVFIFNPNFKKHLMVATVTGVVPFVSIARQAVHDRLQGHQFYIIEGASYFDELVFDNELGALAREFPQMFTYVPTVSRPTDARNTGWTGLTGRANTLVEQCIERHRLDVASTLVYACGHPGMIEVVKQQLMPKGYKVTEERFWKE
ncbi:MAG: ferredoxin--NADP reductase [Dehalococcoidia bacterium]|nr:ferredoxin--NADP reductase [Dehalococcoidia bacterium]